MTTTPYKYWCPAIAHASLFFAVAVAVWRVRAPESTLPEAIQWYGGMGLFLWQLLPFGWITQLIVESVLAAAFLVIAVQACRGKMPFLVPGNAMLAVLYLFPFAVSTFGIYTGP